MKKIMIIIALIAVCIKSNAQQNNMKRYTEVPGGYMMVLRIGDDLLQQLEDLAKAKNIPSATFTGIGFVNVTFGFFDFETKQYKPHQFNNVELTSLAGSIGWKDGQPSIHAHGVVGDQSFQSHAGHILNSTVSTGSVEIRILTMDKKLQRKKDERIGADVLNLE